MKPLPNALSALPSWIRRSAAPIAVVTLTYLGREGSRENGADLRVSPEDRCLKTSNLNFNA
ncbi:hypothetical protein GCM10009680_75310 [Streptomyces yatensis]|uniref:Uncharacterized protein n=1 Tax=Streptomyces yatensis TaxID=155177 RepID=A0ABP4VG19_9ACTN